jgi:5-(carboxyamino)imidazole ribonucleotide mutase
MSKAVATRVGVIMGSVSDWSVMEHASTVLTELGVDHECKVISAHRMPIEMAAYGESAVERGLHCIIAGAGGAAHLPGMVAAHTWVPVLGVPIPSTALQGVDSLYSIVQMPAGVPVATFAIGRPGAVNAALFAAAMLARAGDDELDHQLTSRRMAAHAAALESSGQLKVP